MKIELVFYCGSTLLEGPIWSKRENLLYFISIEQSLIYRINPDTGEVNTFKTIGHVGCIALHQNGLIIYAEKTGIYSLDPNNGNKSFITHCEKDSKMRYNDGIIDKNGRFLVGTKGDQEEYPGKGKLYSYEKNKTQELISGVTISNGIDFSNDNSKMYYVDTPSKKIAMYKYDLKTGNIMFLRNIIEITGGGLPDGICVDIDDMLWVAEWEGGKVCKWNPNNGKKLIEIKMPMNRVTSCCIGGKNLDYLYITSAKETNVKDNYSGGLFRVKIR